jgi:short-chain Z-isoprenyl diphosphate synthase
VPLPEQAGQRGQVGRDGRGLAGGVRGAVFQLAGQLGQPLGGGIQQPSHAGPLRAEVQGRRHARHPNLGRRVSAKGAIAGRYRQVMLLRDLLIRLYARRLRAGLAGDCLPRHVALIMDGNRRWARQAGLASPSLGHKHGAEHVADVLGWCEAAGIRHVTVFVCSTENLLRRGDAEVAYLMQVIEQVVADKLTVPDPRWQVHVAGVLDVLPDSTARALKRAVAASRDCPTGAHVTLAIGYSGRAEVIDAISAFLYEQAEAGASLADVARTVTTEDIARHLYTAGQPDPDLVIRTSGEQRMSNFLLWQSAHSELYFCDAYWPAFREIDFLRALRTYSARRRRDRA